MRNILFYLLVFIPILVNSNPKLIHTFVALCDNENQGIVPVSESLGNGQKPCTNLYWGAGYGIKTYFKSKTQNWKLVKSIPSKNPLILERLLFKLTNTNTYMLADAYDGKYI